MEWLTNMTCDDVIPLLSPFHDGELAAEQRQAVEDHLSFCEDCSRKLESLQNLSSLVDNTAPPQPPKTLLSRIVKSLDSNRPFPKQQTRYLSRTVIGILLTSAAIVFVTLIVWQGSGVSPQSHREMVRAFASFLSLYESGEASANDFLAEKYQGAVVSSTEASKVLKRETVARPMILAQHQASKRYLLKMPCCDCIQTIYTRNNRTTFVVFEHEKAEEEWFAARPSIHTECDGKVCCLVELKRNLAASWQTKGGYVTVVGISDVVQLESLMRELEPR